MGYKAKHERYDDFVQAVVDACENTYQWQLRPFYYGRAMFGRTCLGVVVPNAKSQMEFVFHLGQISGSSMDGAGFALPKVYTDSMGLNTIVYWPDVGVEEQKEASS